MDKITLYGYATSPFVMKVGCYLQYKKLPFEFVPVNPVTPTQIKFTQQRQVPVLKIGDEWRKDSSQLGIWLDEHFPEKSIMGGAQREEVLAIDDWVSEHLIPARFRAAVQWESTFDAIRNGWTLSTAVNAGTPIPKIVRLLWPFFVRKAGFIVDMVKQLDLNESMPDMRQRLCTEFVTHLADGPFLGGLVQPSLADLSAYPTIVAGHLMGMRGKSAMLEHKAVIDWSRRVQTTLPDNPLLVPDYLLKRAHL
jgi:glutathione S-transferase